MTDLTCGEFEDLSAELALGVLEGRQRADALAHVERCAACRQELMALGGVADRLVELTPSAEPPAGFETRVLARLTPAATDGAAVAGRRARPGARGGAWRGAVAAAVAVAIGLGGWAIGHQGAASPSPSAAARSLQARAASFVAGTRTVGVVVTYGGAHPWVAMSVVDSGLGDRSVTCELVERDGTTSAVGTYTLAAGYGYWGAPIPVAPATLTGVRLVDTAGATLAAATFPSRPAS